MVLNQQHLREVVNSHTVNETSVSSGEELKTIGRSGKAVDSAKKLSPEQELGLVVRCREEEDLAVTATHNNTVNGDSADRLDALGARVDVESHGLVLDLEGEQVTGL